MLQSQAHGTNGCSEGHPVDRKATFFLLAPSLQCEVFASLMQYSVADRKIGVLMLEEEEKKKKKTFRITYKSARCSLGSPFT